MPDTSDLNLDITQSMEINAAIGDAWSSVIRRLGAENVTSDNRPMPMVLEQWPGGRWFRDLGAGQGHWWGFVQVIKPPTLLEIHGPMFMSYAVSGHLQLRLTQTAGGCELKLRHRVLGLVNDEHREAINPGWQQFLITTKKMSEGKSTEHD